MGETPCEDEICPKDIAVEQKKLIMNSATSYSESQLVVVDEALDKLLTPLSFGCSFIQWR